MVFCGSVWEILRGFERGVGGYALVPSAGNKIEHHAKKRGRLVGWRLVIGGLGILGI